MTQTLLDFIATREAEIKSLKAGLNAELKQLKAAKAAATEAAPTEKSVSARNLSGKRTIKDMILGALDEFPQGAGAESIILKIEEKFGDKIARSSMSPQLTRLKNDGLVVRENNLWKHYKFAATPAAGVSNPAPVRVSNNVGADRQTPPPMGVNQPVPTAQTAVSPPPHPFQPVAPEPLGQGGQQLMPNRRT